jgi:hypothetical protein
VWRGGEERVWSGCSKRYSIQVMIEDPYYDLNPYCQEVK